MKPKYTFEKLDGTFVYPDCPETINSKEDLQRWFEHCGQITENINDLAHLKNLLPSAYLQETKERERGYTELIIKFPRCKYTASALFYQNECSRISL